MSDVTQILSQIEQGDPAAAEQLLPLVYDELRKLAAVRLAQEKPGQTLQATALVHEAYLRLVGRPDGQKERRSEGETEQGLYPSVPPSLRPSVPTFDSRGHFFAAAAEAMRRILVEQARRKRSAKAGGGMQRASLDECDIAAPTRSIDLIALDEALTKLAGLDRRKCELVKLRYFAGLTIEQAAQALGVAASTADADWAYVKSWLRVELADEPPGDGS
jgi:RNA polymerase sigma factor (sigma-70 family)